MTFKEELLAVYLKTLILTLVQMSSIKYWSLFFLPSGYLKHIFLKIYYGIVSHEQSFRCGNTWPIFYFSHFIKVLKEKLVSEDQPWPGWINEIPSIPLPIISLKCDLNHNDFLDLCAWLISLVTEAEESISLWLVLA